MRRWATKRRCGPEARAGRRSSLVALLAIVVLAGGAPVAVSAPSAKPERAVPGELIVGFHEGVSEGQQTAALAKAGATRKRKFKQIHAVLAGVPENESVQVSKVLEADPRVRYVEPNHIVSIAAVPNDPSFSQLWGLNNTGQTGGTPDADIDAPEAWDVQTGSASVVVAVTDTGIDFSHPDLAAQQWVNTAETANGADDDGNGYVDDLSGWDWVSDDNVPFDDHSHGTHVSGTIGAVGDNGIGVSGVSQNVRLMALKFLDATGNGNTADSVSATLYAASMGARIASNSWGKGPFDQSLLDAIEYGATQGMLFVAAAGNDAANLDTTPDYPASYASDAIITVAATDAADGLAFYSNYGPNSVDLGAPGDNIYSTVPGGYGTKSGTSMSAPHVSGVAALLAAQFPGATPYGMRALLMRSADPIVSLNGKTVTGGRLNAAAAVSCEDAPEVVVTAPLPTFTIGVGESLPIKVLGANCAAAAGLANVSVTVNGATVPLTAAGSDSGLYTGSYVPGAVGAVTVSATVSVGAATASQTVGGTAAQTYNCVDVADTWVDVTPGTRLSVSGQDDGYSTLNLGFPFTLFGQTYTQAYVSSNGFLAFGSTAGADAFKNAAIPTSTTPNGIIAPFWDDLSMGGLFGGTGSVYAGLTGAAPNRALHVEWYGIAHFGPVGTATFEVSLYESSNEIRLRYLDTDFGDSRYNAGQSATAGVENQAGTIGRQISFNQPLLTSGKKVSCTYGAASLPTPTITTASLTDGTTTQPYADSLAATGGTAPYTWSIQAGALPPGVTLDTSTGALSGSPSSAGAYTFTARVTDAASQSATKALSITVFDPVVITTTSLPGGIVGQGYSQTVSATGGKTPYAWSVSVGSLPPGLGLDPTTGAISGTPTAAGTSNFTVQVTDAAGLARTDTQALSITVLAPVVITTTSLEDGTTTQAYSDSLAATGGAAPYTWSIDSGGSLPPGLTLDPSTGAIAGSPTVAGPFAFTARVTDAAAQSATKALSIAVTDPLEIATTSLPGGIAGQAYSQAVAAAGGKTPYAWSVSAGSLPPGLGLNPVTGAITGTPTAAGTSNFTLQVTDAGNPLRTDTQGLSITVLAPLVITTTSLPAGSLGQLYSQTVLATGGTPAYAWSISAGALPPGLGLNPVTGAITGTPTATGPWSFTVRVADSGAPAEVDTQDFSITISSAPPLVITTTSPLSAGRVGTSYSKALLATGGVPAYSWIRVSGKLPPGLTLSPAGVISGTPTKRGTYTFTVRATDSLGAQATKAFSLTIARA